MTGIPPEDLHERFKCCISALNDEISALQSARGRASTVYDGHACGTSGGLHLYVFTMDFEFFLPDDCPVRVKHAHGTTNGVVIATQRNQITIGLEDDAGEEIPQAELYSAVWFLLEAQRDCLAAALQRDSGDLRLAARLLGATPARCGTLRAVQDTAALRSRESLRTVTVRWNAHQISAAARVCGSEVAFVWGPPGTGKTTTLALAVAGLLEQGERILVCSHSNAAVDVAMLTIAETMRGTHWISDGSILRYGNCWRRKELRDAGILPEVILERLHPDLVARLAAAESEFRALLGSLRKGGTSGAARTRLNDRLDKVRNELKDLRKQLSELELELARQARVLGATLSKVFVSAAKDWTYDAVLIDEVSMVYVPTCLAASLVPRRRMAVFGDFRQLPPISQAETQTARLWLQTDIFHHGGIVGSDGQVARTDPRLSILTEQYRMHPDICAIANKFFYDGILTTADQREDEIPAGVRDFLTKRRCVIVDIGDLNTRAGRQPGSRSHYNPASAALSAGLGARIAAMWPGEVSVIAPYHFQARLISHILKEQKTRGSARCSTVHRFQGNEAPVVIIDLTDAEGLPGVGRLLRGTFHEEGGRLINVAITRARSKLILVGDCAWIEKNAGSSSVLRSILEDAMFEEDGKVPGMRALREISAPLMAGTPGITLASGIDAFLDAIRTELKRGCAEVLAQLEEVDPRLIDIFIDPSRVRGQIRVCTPLSKAREWKTRYPRLEVVPETPLPSEAMVFDRRVSWLLLRGPGGIVGVRIESSGYGRILADILTTGQRVGGARASFPASVGRELVENAFGFCRFCSGILWIDQAAYGPCLRCLGCNKTQSLTRKAASALAKLSGVSCERCGATMVARRGPTGSVFLGCSNYPACTGTRDLKDLI